MSNAIELTTKNKTLYRRFLQEVFVEGHVERLDEFVTPAFVNHDARPGAPAGPEGVRQIVELMRAGLPDLTITVEEQVAEGEIVCSRATTRGTHRGMLFGHPPTGKVVSMTGLTMTRIVDGRLVESWVKNDFAGMMRQLETT